jgi:ubiquinone/menaquinone biosynthesis C-methylase UbiE
MHDYYENMYSNEFDFESLKNIKKLAPLKRIKKELVKKYCKGEKILELGCGLGEYISMFNKEVYGSDIALNALGKAKLFCPGGRFFQANAESLPLKSESFDCVILPDIIEHVENDESLIDELNRIVKKKGRIILITPSSNKFETKNCDIKLWKDVVGEGGDLRKYGLELIDKFYKRGFRDVKIRFVGGPFTKLINKLKIKVLKKKGYERKDILSGKVGEMKKIGFYSKVLYLLYKFDYLLFGRLRGKYMFLVMEKNEN